MYKLLIVDDDEIMRRGLQRNIRWADYGFELTPAASDGVEGLEIVDQYKPDIVLSDIRMPFMDGLEMAEKILDRYPHVKVILLTGYEDFQYAMKAVNIRVSQYILKHAEREEIVQAVVNARDELEKLKSAETEKQRNNSLTLSRLLQDAMMGLVDGDELERELNALGVQLRSQNFCVSVISVDDYRAAFKDDKAENLEQVIVTMVKLCEESFSQFDGVLAFANFNNRVQVVYTPPEEDDNGRKSIFDTLQQIKSEIEKRLDLQITVSVGNVYAGFGKMNQSYREAMSVDSMKDILGRGGMTSIGDVRDSEKSNSELLKQIVHCVDQNYSNENFTLNDIAAIVHVSPTYISTIFKKYKGINFKDYLIDIRIKKAIELFTNTDLKIYQVSEKVGYSNPQYFSVLFKKTTGYSPTEFKELKRVNQNPDNE